MPPPSFPFQKFFPTNARSHSRIHTPYDNQRIAPDEPLTNKHMASLMKKGGAGKSLPGECTEDAAKAVQGAISQLADKYGVDLDANAKAAWKEEEKKELTGNVQDRYDAAATDFRKAEELARQQRAKGSGKFISQETFDMVVQENIEDFEMEPDEAARDAVEQFESQGIDLSNIVQTSGGANSGPVPGVLAALDESMAVDDAVRLMKQLQTLVDGDKDDAMIAASKDACGSVSGAVGRIDKESVPLVRQALLCFATLQQYPVKKQVDVLPLYPVVKPVLRMVFESPSLNDVELWAVACRVARWSCAKNEAAKASLFTSYGFDGHIRTALRRGLGWSADNVCKTGLSHGAIMNEAESGRAGRTPHLPLLREACLLLAIVLVDDDRRQGVQPATFGRARLLGDQKKVATTCIGEIVEALRLASGGGGGVDGGVDEGTARKFGGDVGVAVRCLAVTDEICADFTERGATEMLIQLMQQYGDDPRLCSRCCLALKMIR